MEDSTSSEDELVDIQARLMNYIDKRKVARAKRRAIREAATSEATVGLGRPPGEGDGSGPVAQEENGFAGEGSNSDKDEDRSRSQPKGSSEGGGEKDRPESAAFLVVPQIAGSSPLKAAAATRAEKADKGGGDDTPEDADLSEKLEKGGVTGDRDRSSLEKDEEDGCPEQRERRKACESHNFVKELDVGEWLCDNCEARFQLTEVYTCSKCELDLCGKCHKEAGKEENQGETSCREEGEALPRREFLRDERGCREDPATAGEAWMEGTQPVREPGAGKENRRNCKDHDFVEEVVPEWSCDNCKGTFQLTRAYTCSKCDFDLCETCHGEDDQRRRRRGQCGAHNFEKQKEVSSWMCDECGEFNQAADQPYSCAGCETDLCEECCRVECSKTAGCQLTQS